MTIEHVHMPLSKVAADWLIAVANPFHAAAPAGMLPLPSEIASVLWAAELHGVLPVVLRALSPSNSRQGAAPFEGGGAELELARQAIANARTRQLHQTGFELLLRHHAEQTLTALRAAGIAAAILKGPVFARRLYAQPTLRTFTDIDILIPFEARAAVSEVLQRGPFRLQTHDYREGKDYCEDQWVLVENPRISIEIHTDLVHNPKLRRAASATLSDVLNAGNGDAEEATALLFVATVHGAVSHQFDRLQHLVDVALAASGAAGAVDAERLATASRASGVMTAVHGALVLAGAAFAAAQCLALARALRPSLLDRLASGLVTPQAVLDARSNRRSASSWRRKALRQALRVGGRSHSSAQKPSA
jgi:hypothetical protein